MTAENVAGSQYPYSPEAVGSAGAVQSRQTTSISLSVSLSEDIVPTGDILREEFNQQDSAAGNRLTVGNKFAMGQGARSFESALGATSARPEASETARMCFGNTAHSFESTLPHYRSFEQNIESHSMYFDPMIPQKIDIPRSTSETNTNESRTVLEIPIHNERRRHSFGPAGNEGLSRAPEIETTRHSSAFSVRQSPTGEDGRRVLRKQVAIDVVEEPLRSEAYKARYPPFLQLGSKELEKEEKRVISHYNIDAYSFAKQTSREKHVTVIRNPPNQGVPSVLSNHYQGMKETGYSSVGPSSDSEISVKPTINVISNRTSAISSKYRSHYLEPKETLRGLSSGSEESPGNSSREPSPFRKEPVRAVSPYSKELKYSSPTPVIKTQVKKEVSDLGYELQTQSSSGSEGTFPEITNIVITTDTGESMRCKTEDSDSFESSDHSQHRRHLHPGNFKKHLHARYLSSLRNRASSSSTDTSQEHLSQEMSDSLNRSSDVFESTDAENVLVKQMLKPILITHEGSSETSDDNDIQMSTVIKSPPHSEFETSHIQEASPLLRDTTHTHERYEQLPLDLSHGFPSEAVAPSDSEVMGQSMSHGPHMDLGSGTFSDPDLLSPSLAKQTSSFHRSPHLHSPFVQSPHSTQSSPLCSVPEGGRIFHFNFPSPFEGTHAHSDPEFGTPSPMSPGLHFTFPPRASMLSSMSELNRLAVSPRAYYPNQPLQLSPLTKKPSHSPSFRDIGHCERRTFSDSDAYLCPVCGQVFPSYDNLAKHMAKHLPTETIRSGDNNKIHYCKVCNRSFSRSDMLTRHMRLHTGLKPYECDACGQVFSRSDHLNTHRRTHTGEKPYRCPQCSYAACRRDMITRHMRTHTKRGAKRGKFLSVPERESSEIRKSSVSSTDTTSSQEMSSRTFSASSGDSLDLESNTSASASASVSVSKSAQSLMSVDSSEMDIIPSKPRNWSTASTESIVFEEHAKLTHSSSMESKFISSTHMFRQTRNWSTTSFESVESEDTVSRNDSLAEDTIFENEPINNNNSPLPIEHESFEKCSISSDKNTSNA